MFYPFPNFHQNLPITFRVNLLTDWQTESERQTNGSEKQNPIQTWRTKKNYKHLTNSCEHREGYIQYCT